VGCGLCHDQFYPNDKTIFGNTPTNPVGILTNPAGTRAGAVQPAVYPGDCPKQTKAVFRAIAGESVNLRGNLQGYAKADLRIVTIGADLISGIR
jgi:hypothetical protein